MAGLKVIVAFHRARGKLIEPVPALDLSPEDGFPIRPARRTRASLILGAGSWSTNIMNTGGTHTRNTQPPWTESNRSESMNQTVHGKPIEILLVENDADDACLTIEALREGKVLNNINVVEDGVEAMSFLRREGKNAAAPRPDLVLLDLHMPRKNGLEVLAEIKEDPELKRIPVVMMTTSDDERHVYEAYNRHANCYVTKPVDLDQFIGVVKSIESFWLTIVKLPAA